MDEKKKRLLELIGLLKSPLLVEDVKRQMESLNEEEMGSLLEVYESIYEYETLLDDIAKTANPEEYKRLKDKYDNDVLAAELEYTDKLEGVQEQADNELELFDQELEKKSETDSYELKKKFQEIEDTGDDLSLGFKPLPSEDSQQ